MPSPRLVVIVAVLLFGCTTDEPVDAGATDAGSIDAGLPDAERPDAGIDAGRAPPEIRVFTRTTGYRHDSIGEALTMLDELASERGWVLTATENPDVLDGSLDTTDAVVFLMTTGDVLNDAQQTRLEAWFRAGGAFVGVHSATDTEYDWPFYGELVGARFERHPAIQPAVLTVEDRTHTATAHLSATWARTDEWYDFSTNPRGTVHVLLTIDEATYTGGMMGADHPMAWTREIDSGRSFYTALGHTSESYAEADFRAHVVGGLTWALNR